MESTNNVQTFMKEMFNQQQKMFQKQNEMFKEQKGIFQKHTEILMKYYNEIYENVSTLVNQKQNQSTTNCLHDQLNLSGNKEIS